MADEDSAMVREGGEPEELDAPALRGWGQLRSRHLGHLHQVDLSIYVPGELSVAEAHARSDRVEAAIREALGEAEVLCHVEPDGPR